MSVVSPDKRIFPGKKIMLHELPWHSFQLPEEALRWRAEVERISGLRVQLLRDDSMSDAEGEAWSEQGLRAVVLASDGNAMTIVHELGHLRLETLGWPHCYLCGDDLDWIDRYYGLLSDLVSLIEHRAFFPAMLNMGLDPYAASEADLADPDVLAALRVLPAGVTPDWGVVMQLMRALLETGPVVAERVMQAASHLVVESWLARRLAGIASAAPLTPDGFSIAMRGCWALLGFPRDSLQIGEEDAGTATAIDVRVVTLDPQHSATGMHPHPVADGAAVAMPA